VLVSATITDALFNATTDFVADSGTIGIFILMLLDAACIPIPSEITMLFGGFTVSQGHNDLIAITAAGLLGNVTGSWLAFGVGRYGRQWLEKRSLGRRLISQKHLAAADRWFARYGEASVLIARVIPIARTFISLPAGASKLTWTRFTLLTVIGCLPWVLAFAVLGDVLGQHWAQLRGALQYADYAVLALAAVALAYVLITRSRRRMARQ
jgi:membrane protein DedA with SNARE-associated domain